METQPVGTVRVGWAIPVCRGTLLTQLHWLATGVEVAAEPGVCVSQLGRESQRQSPHPHGLAGSALAFRNLVLELRSWRLVAPWCLGFTDPTLETLQILVFPMSCILPHLFF